MRVTWLLLPLFALAGCNSEIYLQDGVTDGDTFYLAPRALSDDDPALQSWVTYSLSISACQLGIGGDNPARATSFECELKSRELLLDTWRDHKRIDPEFRDAYLDDLDAIERAGYLPEHVARHFGRRHWELPPTLEVGDYRRWERQAVPGLEPETRLVGSWNYARNVSGF